MGHRRMPAWSIPGGHLRAVRCLPPFIIALFSASGCDAGAEYEQCGQGEDYEHTGNEQEVADHFFLL